MKIRIPATWLAIVLLTACASTKVSKPVERPPGEGSVEVRIEGISTSEGKIFASIYLSPDGFPDSRETVYAYQSAPAAPGAIVFTFPSVPAGPFAVSVLHDADGNEELSSDFIGIPEEDYGFSQNPESTFGPPDFGEAAVNLAAGETKSVVVQITE